MKLLFIFLALPLLAAARPNILFITVDDMSRDSVGAYGCPIKDITPNIDKLASQGIAFDRGFVTIAICQPTRAVWMTGRYPHRNGALGFDPINKDVPSLPEALKDGGYFNALLGKTTHVVPTRHAAFDLIYPQKELGQGRSPSAYAKATRLAIADAAKEERPFFIMANTHDPHRPFAGSKAERYTPRPKVRRTITPEEAIIPGFLPDLPKVREELATYFTSVHRADEVVGAILAELEKSGHTEDTLVVFMSDHGMPLPYAKTNCYQASNMTPWIVRWPGHAKANTRDTTHFVSGIDLAPSLLDAAGLAPLKEADGKSILPLLEGKKQPDRRQVFTMINRTAGKKEYTMRAVNNGDFIYIWNGWADGKTAFKNESQAGLTFKAMRKAGETDPAIAARTDFFVHRCTEEMYDLKADPDCLHNLIAKPNDKWTPRSSAMSKSLWHFMKRSKDPQIKLFQNQVELALD